MSKEDVSPKIGVSFVTSREPVSIGHALVGGAVQTVTIMGYIIEGIGQLIIGKANVEDLSGPVGLFQMASFELDRGWIFSKYYGHYKHQFRANKLISISGFRWGAFTVNVD